MLPAERRHVRDNRSCDIDSLPLKFNKRLFKRTPRNASCLDLRADQPSPPSTQHPSRSFLSVCADRTILALFVSSPKEVYSMSAVS